MIARQIIRRYASAKGPSPMRIFDRRAKQIHRDWAAALPNASEYEYVKSEVGYTVGDRVQDICRYFPVAVDFGCGKGWVGAGLEGDYVGHLVQLDMSPRMVKSAQHPPELGSSSPIIADEETVGLRPNSVDLALSSLAVHWINDLPGFFKRVYNALVPDGPFICAVFGGDTLYELRCSLQLAELERKGGISQHISPFTQANDISGLMGQAGFQLITLDTDEMVVHYPDVPTLMYDLQGMAENMATYTRSQHLSREVLIAAQSIYKAMYGKEDGTFPATFNIIYVIGWKPCPTTPKPIRRGSAKHSFKDLGTATIIQPPDQSNTQK